MMTMMMVFLRWSFNAKSMLDVLPDLSNASMSGTTRHPGIYLPGCLADKGYRVYHQQHAQPETSKQITSWLKSTL
jgi:hypothetical protein